MVYPAKENVLKTFQKLINLLPESERTKPQALLLAGSATPFRNDTDREMTFRQESNFYYLSGCTIPSSFLFVGYKSGTSFATHPKMDLFVPKIEEADLMWSVPPPQPSTILETHEVTSVDHHETLEECISDFAKAFPEALIHTLPRNSPLFPEIPAKYTELVLSLENGGQGAVTDMYLLKALHQARLVKSEYEIDKIRKANEISSRAHEVVMRVLGKAVKGEIKKAQGRVSLPGEWLIEKEAEAEAIFVASCRREGSVHQAYLPIVASSTRASTLHYCCNDREFAWGPVSSKDHKNHDSLASDGNKQLSPQVLLIDAGCEWEGYASDITRTMPVGNGGKFTTESREIYELALQMQKETMAITRPGIHWDAVHLLAHRVLIRGFQKLGIFKKDEESNTEEQILHSGVTTAFFPHGLGHSIGMDVHDVPSASKPEVNPTIDRTISLGPSSLYTNLRLRLKLEANMVVTIEPGIYFHPHLLSSVRNSPHIDHAVLNKYEHAEGHLGGVRIEDVVVVRDGGVENLTTVGSERVWVEKVCAGEA
jgi:Xaa-Pro dipeptidase